MAFIKMQNLNNFVYIILMATVYTKSLAADFSGNLRSDQFHEEVEAELGIVPNILSVTVTADVVNITFDTALSAGEETTLDGLISAHTPDNSPDIIAEQTLIPTITKYSTTFYTRVLSYIYKPTQVLEYIKVISYQDTPVTSYDITVSDVTNNNQIALANFVNTSQQINDLGTLTNIPESEAIFEMYIRKTGGSENDNVHIESVVLYYS